MLIFPSKELAKELIQLAKNNNQKLMTTQSNPIKIGFDLLKIRKFMRILLSAILMPDVLERFGNWTKWCEGGMFFNIKNI